MVTIQSLGRCVFPPFMTINHFESRMKENEIQWDRKGGQGVALDKTGSSRRKGEETDVIIQYLQLRTASDLTEQFIIYVKKKMCGWQI